MIKLCVDSLEITMLEWMLKKNDIPYELDRDAPDCGIAYPYLVVDGVPLDADRAMKWIRGRCKHE